jgi:hypothetical protein
MTYSMKRRLLAAILAVTGALGCQEPDAPIAAALVSGHFGITSIAVDDFYLYFAKKDKTIHKVSLDGGPIIQIASGIDDEPRQLAVDAMDVYWSTAAGGVGRTPKDGGELIPLVEGLEDLRELTLDEAHVYFTIGAPGKPGSIRKVSKADAVMTTMVENEVDPGPIAQNAGYLYWARGAKQSAVRSAAVSDAEPLTMVDAQAGTNSVATDPSFVYWSNFGDSTVSRSTYDGSDVRVVAASPSPPSKVAGDGLNAYWTAVDGSLYMAPLTGGAEPTALSSGPTGAMSLALDATSIYWSRLEAGTVVVRPKPLDGFTQ